MQTSKEKSGVSGDGILPARRIALVSFVVSAAVLAASACTFLAVHVRHQARRRGRRHLTEDAEGMCSPSDYLSQSAALPDGCRRSSDKPRPVIDVLSIGSLERLGFLERQRRGWASGEYVRYFWGASELDDSHPTCAVEMEVEDVVKHAIWCHKADRNETLATSFYKREEDPFGYVMQRKGNIPGWFCAQRRPGESLARVGALYRNLTGSGGSLPDYLLLVDDDTFVNLPLLSAHLQDIDTNVPIVHAGCLFPKKLPFPFGGFGLFYSKGAVSRLIRPIHCLETARGFEADVCTRLRENLMGEKSLFRPGMSISDLMAAFSASENLCMHSDWITGYFVNFYGLSVAAEAAPEDQRFGYNRLTALSGTTFGAEFKEHVQNQCRSESALVCHKVPQNPGEMEEDALAKEEVVTAAVFDKNVPGKLSMKE